MTGKNVGDLLNEHNVTWGWFEGGFTPTETKEGKAACGSSHVNVAGATVTDYVQHHEPFQYYASTANPHHLPPSLARRHVGQTDQANHQYDLSYFDEALKHGNMPSVSFLKAAAYEDGHAGYSDPLDEQRFLTNTINQIEQSPDWSSTAIVIAYDDSDGWYDHVMGPIVRPSDGRADALTGDGKVRQRPRDAPGGLRERPLRLRPAAAAAGDLAVGEAELRRQHAHRPELDPAVHRGQLGAGPHRRRIDRRRRRARSGTCSTSTRTDPRAPKLTLDETTGEVVSGVAVPATRARAARAARAVRRRPGRLRAARAAVDSQGGSGGGRAARVAPAATAAPGNHGKSGPKVSCKASGKRAGKQRPRELHRRGRRWPAQG